jgi:DNA-binding CsgD family transcriptional regulator
MATDCRLSTLWMGDDMVANAGSSVWVPPWVQGLGLAVWISGPGRKIVYINDRAADLLGGEVSELLGRPCYEVIGGRDGSGETFCSTRCPVFLDASGGRELEPIHLLLDGGAPRERWVQVLPICVRGPGFSGPWLVHCVLTEDKAHRLETYLTKVATRTQPREPEAGTASQFALTGREEEILHLLADDETLQAIATELGLSYATVRNHVQHILAKLGVHSIMEAVAYYLLAKD